MQMGGSEEAREGDAPTSQTRPCIKTRTSPSFNNYSIWKQKLRENCCKRVRNDRTQLLWKMRMLPPQSNDDNQEFIKSTLQGIVSDELRKIKGSSFNDHACPPTPETDDMLWEYDGLHSVCEGECEEILLEMQRIFYDDLRVEQAVRGPENCIKMWEDEEDEYLAHAVYEHMQLNDEQVQKKVWCPICKQGELQENCSHIFCTHCDLKLYQREEVTLDSIRVRLAEAHAEHFDRGCRLKPKFCMESKFNITALYIECQGCSTFDVVI